MSIQVSKGQGQVKQATKESTVVCNSVRMIAVWMKLLLPLGRNAEIQIFSIDIAGSATFTVMFLSILALGSYYNKC